MQGFLHFSKKYSKYEWFCDGGNILTASDFDILSVSLLRTIFFEYSKCESLALTRLRLTTHETNAQTKSFQWKPMKPTISYPALLCLNVSLPCSQIHLPFHIASLKFGPSRNNSCKHRTLGCCKCDNSFTWPKLGIAQHGVTCHLSSC